MISAYADFWRRYFDFDGRFDRSDFWWAVVANILVVILLLAFLIATGQTSFTIVLVTRIYAIFTIIPHLSLGVRRLRDAGYHWAYIFLIFIPFGNLFLLFLYCLPTEY